MNHSKCWMVRILRAAVIVCGLILSVATPSWAQQKSLKQQLVGAWELVSIEVTTKDGAKRPGFGGPNAKGVLILDASGRYAQVTGNPDRPKVSTKDRKAIPAAELGEAARSFGARYGAWSVSEADKTLVLTSELPMIADGGKAEQSISVTGNELRLVESHPVSKTEFVFRRAR